MNSPSHPPPESSRLLTRAYELLPLIHPEDQRKFRRKFENETAEQAAHSTRELFLGVFLIKNGLFARHELLTQGKTPDWVVLNETGVIEAIFDQITFHQTPSVANSMNTAVRNNRIWADWVPDNTPRLYQKLHEKADRYAFIAESKDVPFVVSVFSEFLAAIDRDELNDALFEAYDGGVFAASPHISGVVFSAESCGRYAFEYIANPRASTPMFIVNAQV